MSTVDDVIITSSDAVWLWLYFSEGIDVGGHRRLRPSILTRELRAYDVVNVGAEGTLVVRKPGSRASVLAELRRKLPFEAEIAFCDGNFSIANWTQTRTRALGRLWRPISLRVFMID